MREPQVAHVENSVQDNQRQISARLQHMQFMIQAMRLQYVAVPKPTYQAYGGQGKYGENNVFRGRGGRGDQRRGKWQVGHGGRGSSDLNHYFWTHVMCARPMRPGVINFGEVSATASDGPG